MMIVIQPHSVSTYSRNIYIFFNSDYEVTPAVICTVHLALNFQQKQSDKYIIIIIS